VVYRAPEHWGKLKPPALSENEVRTRGLKLREAAAHVIGTPITNIFAKGDSFMGSGVDWMLTKEQFLPHFPSARARTAGGSIPTRWKRLVRNATAR